MGKEFQMIAKTFKGLEGVLADELVNLGANDVQIDRRAVSFTGDKALMYKANLHLRTASRILKPIHTFKALTADEVYEQVKTIDWSLYMAVNQTFAIDATVYSEVFRNSQFVKYRAKDAIADWFVEHYDKRPSIRIDNPDIYINLHISHDICTISLDSSGESLHKRGYRDAQTEAPINEALAAGMLLMAGWNGQCDFVDPMCGSGTFLIEAALIALNIPPCIYRSTFAFEKWIDYDAELFDTIYNDDSEEREFSHQIIGCDISPRALKIAETNIKSAGLSKHITLEQRNIADWEEQNTPCLIVTNPPYGERLAPNDIIDLYSQIGSTLKHKFAGSTAWIISSNDEMLQNIGLHASKKVELLNGALECSFNKYELFSGKRNDFVRERKQHDTHENSSTDFVERKPYKERNEHTRRFHDERPFDRERKPRFKRDWNDRERDDRRNEKPRFDRYNDRPRFEKSDKTTRKNERFADKPKNNRRRF